MINQQLVDYIKQQLQHGEAKETIKNNLLTQGCQLRDIEEAFSLVEKQNTQSFVWSSSTAQETKTNIEEATPNGKTIASLVLGIIGLIAWVIPLIGAPITIIGLVLGIKGLKSLKRKIAIAGIVLCIIGLVATIANASIGAYLGGTGQHPFVNKIFKQDQSQREAIEITPEPITPKSISTDQLELQPYVNSEVGFKIHPPKGWRVDESGQMGADVFFFNTQTDQEGDNLFNANINVFSEPVQGLNLKGYVDAGKELLPIGLTNYKSIEEREVVVNGREAYIIGGTFVQGVFKLRNLQLMIVEGGKGYVVTATVLESTWNKYKDLIEASLLTFEL